MKTHPGHSDNSAEPDKKQSSLTENRNALRQRLRSARSSLSDAAVSTHSAAIVERLQPLLGSANHVAAYLALGQEARVDTALERLRQRQAHTYVPVIRPGNIMAFAPIHETSQLLINKYGIKEPDVPPEQCLPATDIDVVLVPLVGFDTQGNRMGMGGGYYDRTFSFVRTRPRNEQIRPLLVGIAFDMQQVDSVLPDWWDVPLDHVVTESRLITPDNSQADSVTD